MKSLVKNYPGMIVFIFVFVLGIFVSPSFFTLNNVADILQQTAQNGLLAAGMTLVIIGGGGGVDLSVGSNVALGCMVAAMTQAYAGFPTIASVLLAVVVCAALGAGNGLLITKGHLQPFVATLVTMMGGRAAALLINSGRPVSSGIPEAFGAISNTKIGPFFLPMFIWIIAIILIHILLTRTKYGRDLIASGGNEEAAKYTGINVSKVRFLAYTITGVLAGICGALLCSKLKIGEPRSGEGYEMLAIAAVVMGGTSMDGGRGSALGTMFGVLALGVIANLLNVANVNMYLQKVVEGLIVFVSVLVPVITQYFNERAARKHAMERL
ncbi:MAG: ABC transporter permease [Christensenella sp.]|uniref:ABC transporter permease n=1 Tax=Christensenella sp. TaxID=1935934 RepID=UPI002B206A06|nr:ABC transporter permease [Christensenella sp.]MEA5001945.1 ABC transporter permease [Christensenella sp.]